jgi:NAD(P)-dependent dehydrogenase (short-subunit alcohol dehydrogenase family)
MENQLTGQVALITGGGRGLGRAFALALAQAGARVAVTARTLSELDETVRQVEQSGGQALAIPADVTDRQAMAALVNTVSAAWGPVDLLINNAGIVSPLGPLWEIDPDEWWRSMEINLRSVLLCSAAVLPGMVARRRGRIINVASGAARGPIPYGSAYVTAKTAMVRLTENLATETKEHDIAVFAIDPGTVRTAMTEYLYESAAGRKFTPWFQTLFREKRDVPADLSVQLILRLATGEADALSGRLVGIRDDLDQMVHQAATIQHDELYTLRLGTLTGAE